MQKLTRSILAMLVCASFSTATLAKDVTVMISGGFKAVLEKLAPEYEAKAATKLFWCPALTWGKRRRRSLRGWRAEIKPMW